MHSKKSLIEKKLKINYIMNYKMKIFINKTLIIKLIKTNMKNLDRVVVTKLEIFENELVTIHALEIINNIITGIYFHAYKKILENIMICIICLSINIMAIIICKIL